METKKEINKIIDFKTDKNTLLRFASRARENGELEKCLRYLNRYKKIAPFDNEVIFVLAETYFEMAQYSYAKEQYFKVLSRDFKNDDIYFGLSMCLVAEGDYEAAEYYLSKIDDDVISDMAENIYVQNVAEFDDEEIDAPKLRMVKPRSNEYEEYLLDTAEANVRSGDYEKAILFLNKIEKLSAKFKSAAALKIVCYTVMQNYDKAVELSNELLKKEPDNTSLLCSHYSLLKMQDREDEAKEVLVKLEKSKFESGEEILKGLQAFCLSGSHQKVLELTNSILEKKPNQSETMLMRAIAEYNLGEKEKAVHDLKHLDSIYEGLTVAPQYIKFIEETKPDAIIYSLTEPYTDMLINAAMIEVVINLGKLEFLKRAKANNYQLIGWGIRQLPEDNAVKIIEKCGKCYDESMAGFFKELLADCRTSTAIKHEILYTLLKYGNVKRVKLVVENIYKEIKFPRISLEGLPKILVEAYYISCAEQTIINVEPIPLLESLTVNIENIRKLYERGDVSVGLNQIRSVKTLSAVLSYLSESQTDYFDENEFFNDYNINKKLFLKYMRLIKGEEAEDETR